MQYFIWIHCFWRKNVPFIFQSRQDNSTTFARNVSFQDQPSPGLVNFCKLVIVHVLSSISQVLGHFLKGPHYFLLNFQSKEAFCWISDKLLLSVKMQIRTWPDWIVLIRILLLAFYREYVDILYRWKIWFSFSHLLFSYTCTHSPSCIELSVFGGSYHNYRRRVLNTSVLHLYVYSALTINQAQSYVCNSLWQQTIHLHM